MSTTIEGSRVLVTGGSGLIGSHVVDSLIERGVGSIVVVDKVISQCNLEAACETGKVTVHEVDLRSPEVASFVESCDTVVHLAAMLVRQGISNPRETVDVNVMGSVDLINAASAAGVGRFVFASSVSVYGQAAPGVVLDENSALGAASVYGATKLAVEYYLRAMAADANLDHVSLRFGPVFGPRLSRGGLFPRALFEVLEALDAGRPPVVEAHPDEVQDFLEVGEAADAVIRAIESAASNVPINIASGNSYSMREILGALLQVVGSDREIDWSGRGFTYPSERRFDVSRAETLLGFRSSISMEDGLARFVEWYRSTGTDRAVGGR